MDIETLHRQAPVGVVERATDPAPKAPPRVIVGMALAQFGVLMGLLAPITVSLTIKVNELVPAEQAPLAIASILSPAALVAMLANPVVGRLSDYTTSRLGRRRPWMLAGALGFVLSLASIAAASDVLAVLIAWSLAQLFGNMILAPLFATIADHVPERQRGTVSANVGIMQSLGVLAAAYVASWFVGNTVLLFVGPALIAAALVVLYCIVLPDIRIAERPKEGNGLKVLLMTFWVNPLKHPDFAWVWVSRFLIVISNFLFITFRGVFLGAEVGIKDPSQLAGVVATGVLFNTIALSVAAKAGGWLSDRTGNRKAFVIASTVIFAAGLVMLAMTETVGVFYVVEVIMGVGFGVYLSVDTALVVDVLPNPDDSSKDLGVLNIANSLPQSFASLLGVALLAVGGGTENYTALFWGAGIVGFLGALAMLPVRSSVRRHAERRNWPDN